MKVFLVSSFILYSTFGWSQRLYSDSLSIVDECKCNKIGPKIALKVDNKILTFDVFYDSKYDYYFIIRQKFGKYFIKMI